MVDTSSRPGDLTVSMDFIPVLPMAELALGTMRAVSIGERDVLLCHTKEGVFAVNNVCTHAYSRMHEGRLRGTRLICPLHGASFDVRDGRVLAPPATQPLARHQVRISDGTIEVALATTSDARVEV